MCGSESLDYPVVLPEKSGRVTCLFSPSPVVVHVLPSRHTGSTSGLDKPSSRSMAATFTSRFGCRGLLGRCRENLQGALGVAAAEEDRSQHAEVPPFRGRGRFNGMFGQFHGRGIVIEGLRGEAAGPRREGNVFGRGRLPKLLQGGPTEVAIPRLVVACQSQQGRPVGDGDIRAAQRRIDSASTT